MSKQKAKLPPRSRLPSLSTTPEDPRLVSAMLPFLAALAEKSRLAAFRILWDGRERCVCELMRALDSSQSRMSRHMGILKNVGLVLDRRDQQRVMYKLNPDLPPAVVRLIEAALAQDAAGAERISA